MAATSDAVTQAARLRRIDELAEAIRAARATSTSAPFSPTETFDELRAAGLLALTAPVEFGGAGLWSEGRYRPYYELLETLPGSTASPPSCSRSTRTRSGSSRRCPATSSGAACCPDIVAAGKLLASVGSEAKPSGKLADIARTELEEDSGGAYRLTCQKYFASLSSAADELMIWTAVPGAGPYTERSIIVLVPSTTRPKWR